MNVLMIDYLSENAPELFSTSLHETGFAVLRNHPLDWKSIEQAYQEWATFFNSDEKYNYPFNPERQDGYISSTHPHQAANSKIGIKDLKEVFQLYFPWGQYPNELSDLPRQLFMEKIQLGKTLLSWLDEWMPSSIRATRPKPLAEMVCSERTLYRAIHYPPLQGTENIGAMRAAAHEDFSLLTILPAATAAGLQVQDKQGHWHAVSIDSNTVVVNAGGTLQEASDFYYQSTVHRVVNPEGQDASKARLSLPLFLHAYKEAYLSERHPKVEHYFDEQIKKLALDEQAKAVY
jgi:isopenicillin N synthase-like dioxygenase